MDTTPFLGQAGRLHEARAVRSRPGMSYLATSGGRVRVRRAPAPAGPRILLATDAPNVIEHYDALLEQLAGRADVVLFEPPGTGGSSPVRGFDFTLGIDLGLANCGLRLQLLLMESGLQRFYAMARLSDLIVRVDLHSLNGGIDVGRQFGHVGLGLSANFFQLEELKDAGGAQ